MYYCYIKDNGHLLQPPTPNQDSLTNRLEAGLHNAQMVRYQVPPPTLRALYHHRAVVVGVVRHVVGGAGRALLAGKLD
jgi:hypothetical protein